jgi:Kef-type K+ transport system membrane component KefB
MRILLFLFLTGLLHAAESFAPDRVIRTFPALTTLSLGYLLLCAYLAGSIFKRLGLPKLTGYLATGIFAGPSGIGLLSAATVEDLHIFNGVAIALIAITAGTEMHFSSLRPLFRSIAFISVIAIVGTAMLLTGAVVALSDHLPFLAGLSPLQRLAVGLVLGVTIVAQSPAVVVALRDETDADGPMSRTVLAVVVIGDLLVILLFAVVSAFARGALGESADVLDMVRSLSWEILGSGMLGLLVGGLVSLYFAYVKASGALFVVTVCFVVAEVGARLHLDPLLVALTAGMLIRNATKYGEVLHAEIEAASLPVYVAFFSVAGATIHFDALVSVAGIATILVVVRGVGLVAGSKVATALARAPEVVGKYAGFGLLPQAGVALVLAILFTRSFPDFGDMAAALVFGVVAINEVVAPVLFRIALTRSGEAGARGRVPEAEPEPAARSTATAA